MKAMVMEAVREPLVEKEIEAPEPEPHQVLIRILACGVCRTDRHVFEGDLDSPKLPLVPGHEVVARVEACGSYLKALKVGRLDGVAVLEIGTE